MDNIHGYTITQSVLFDNDRGFALGENPDAVSPFVTWQFTQEEGKRDYYWGHYYGDSDAAGKDFATRTADHQDRYAVRVVEQKLPPIAEQLKAAERLAGERQSQPAPKKDAPDKGDR